jgi:hypothetical protein
LFWGQSKESVQRRKQRLLLTVDGVPYVDLKRSFHDASPNEVSFGRNHVSEYAGRVFRGKILQVRRGKLPALPGAFAGNAFVRLGLEFPKAPAGRQEVLAATGSAEAGDMVFVSYESETSIRLGFRHAGEPPLLSQPLAIQPGQVQRLELGMGSFFTGPDTPAKLQLAGALMVRLNDRLIWMERTAFLPGTGSAPVLGRTAWVRREDDPQDFSGRVVSVQPLDPPAMAPPTGFEFQRYWLARTEPAYGPLRLHLFFPRDQVGKFEPLLVAGSSVSEADYVWLQYVDAGRLVLGYENTGGGGPREVVSVDYAQPHVVEIEIPALFPAPAAAIAAGASPFEAGTAKNRGRFAVDGSVRIDARVKGFPATPAQVTPGENRLSTTFGQKFTGRIFRMETGTNAPPAGFFTESGPLEINLLPSDNPVAGRRELLLASGTAATQDKLWVEYQGPGRARLVFQDSRGAMMAGASFDLAAATPRTLLVQWGGFARGGDAKPARLRVELAGNVLLEGESAFVAGEPLLVWIGGGLADGPGFSGTLSSVRRLPAK